MLLVTQSLALSIHLLTLSMRNSLLTENLKTLFQFNGNTSLRQHSQEFWLLEKLIQGEGPSTQES
ncbi:unnamed protein product [Brassica rapa]|uniref:Uncharacterized protein n=1 Tax=Brassica campestris TaxID=3711 RepID=A0A8D9HSS4_BRACM|nr:unnamed protein product [Brassica rapa]